MLPDRLGVENFEDTVFERHVFGRSGGTRRLQYRATPQNRFWKGHTRKHAENKYPEL